MVMAGNEKQIYWANICPLSRMEKEYLNQEVLCWQGDHQVDVGFNYLGTAEEVLIHGQLRSDRQ